MRALLGAVVVAAAGWLAVADPGALGDAAARLAPVLGFVAAISVVVNLSSRTGAFDTVVAALGRLPGMSGRLGAWALVTGLAAVSTAFFSLDTTVILLTPVAVGLARARGLEVLALALPVIWTANIASLWLPVSNLTNLLADAAGRFRATGGFTAAAWPVSGVTFFVALAASAVALVVYARSPVPAPAATEPGRVGRDVGSFEAHRLRALSLAVLACTLPLLATPVPYWLTAAVAAVVLAACFAVTEPGALRMDLVPWGALLVAAALSVAAAAVHASGISAGLVAAPGGLGVPPPRVRRKHYWVRRPGRARGAGHGRRRRGGGEPGQQHPGLPGPRAGRRGGAGDARAARRGQRRPAGHPVGLAGHALVVRPAGPPRRARALAGVRPARPRARAGGRDAVHPGRVSPA